MNVPQPAANRPLAASPRLAPALAEQIAAHEVWVRDEVDRSVVRVPGSRLFAVGTATLQPAGAELLRPIALALHPIAGRIRVIGHTDGAVARSARYPSDWELSLDRARVVQEALRGLGLEAARLTYDGRANIEPLAAAERTELTGADGRIEIVLLVGR
jgi:type VI secretion system protein ImpK